MSIQKASMAAPAIADRTTATMPPAELPRPKRSETALEMFVVEGSAELLDEAAGAVDEGETMLEEIADGTLESVEGVVIPERAGELLRMLAVEACEAVDEGVTLTVAAPMEKSPVEAKTLVMFPTSTASNE